MALVSFMAGRSLESATTESIICCDGLDLAEKGHPDNDRIKSQTAARAKGKTRSDTTIPGTGDPDFFQIVGSVFPSGGEYMLSTMTSAEDRLREFRRTRSDQVLAELVSRPRRVGRTVTIRK